MDRYEKTKIGIEWHRMEKKNMNRQQRCVRRCNKVQMGEEKYFWGH